MSYFRKRAFPALLLFIGCSLLTKAQNREELEARLLDSMPDSARIETYLQVAETYFPDDPAAAVIWVDRAQRTTGDGPWIKRYPEVILKLINELGNKSNYAERKKYSVILIENFDKHQRFDYYTAGLNTLGLDYAHLGQHDSAKAVFQTLKENLDRQAGADSNYAARLEYLTSIGVVYAIANDLSTAISYFIKADSIAENHGTEAIRMDCRYMLGSAFLGLGHYEKTIEVLKEVERDYENGTPFYNIMATYSNLASAYYMLDQNEIAFKYLDKNLKVGREIGDSVTVGFVFLTRGNMYSSFNENEEAAKSYLKASEVFLEANNVQLYNSVRLQYVKLWLKDDSKLEKGLQISNELIDYYAKQENISALANSYKVKARFEYRLKAFKKAFDAMWMYDSLNAIVLTANFSEQVAELETQFQTDLHKRESEKQSEIANIERQENAQKTILVRLVGAAAFVLSLILVALLMLLRRLRQSRNLINAQKASIEERDREKSMLLKELHHRVKNNLQIVSSLLNLQQENVKDETARGAFKDGQNRVEAMAMIHHYLYATDELTTLKVERYLVQLVSSIAYSYGYGKNEMDLSFNITSKPIDVDLAIPLGLIANELVSNAFKHAYANVDHPKLYLSLSLDDELILSICDNGPGLGDQSFESVNGSFGIDLVKSLANQLKADLHYTFNQGACFTLSISAAGVKENTSTIDENTAA